MRTIDVTLALFRINEAEPVRSLVAGSVQSTRGGGERERERKRHRRRNCDDLFLYKGIYILNICISIQGTSTNPATKYV